MESELEGNVRHALQRQSQLMHMCDQECEASVSRTNASISQAILLLQSRGSELVAATRSCYAQAKTFHADLHARAAAVLAQLHSQPVQSQTRSQFFADAGARLLKILDDARAAPLCVGCGGSSVSVDASNVMKAISELQADIAAASHPMPVMAEVATVSPNAAEIAWKFVPDISSLGGRGACVIRVTECASSSQLEDASIAAASLPAPAVQPPTSSPFSLCVLALENPFWIDGLTPSTRYSVRIGGMPLPEQDSDGERARVPFDKKRAKFDPSSAWAWSSAVEFVTAAASDNVIRRVSDGAVMAGGQIILSEGIAPVGGGWSVFTVGELCAQRRAFVFKIGGRCDKVAVGFCVFGSGSGQEDAVIKRLQLLHWLHCVHNSPRVSYCRTMLIFALQSGGWQQPEFFGVLGGRSGVIAGSLPGAKQPSHSPHFTKAQCSTLDAGSKVDGAADSLHVVALSCSLTDGFLSLAAWLHSSCVMWVESTHVTARAVVLVHGQQSSVTLLR